MAGPPEDVRTFFTTPAPRTPEPLADILSQIEENVMPYPMGNVHPRFWAWYMGSSNYTGAMADFLAAVQGSNLGGGNHATALKEIVGFPASANGILVSGGSMANLIGLTVARNEKAGVDVRENGVIAIEKPLRFYESDQVHACNRKALEALGLGNRALKRVQSDAELRINLSALREAARRIARQVFNRPA
jgi:aromatic-L-amino-acid decarboxylase